MHHSGANNVADTDAHDVSSRCANGSCALLRVSDYTAPVSFITLDNAVHDDGDDVWRISCNSAHSEGVTRLTPPLLHKSLFYSSCGRCAEI